MLVIDDFISPDDQVKVLALVGSRDMAYRIYPTHIFEEGSVLKDKVHAPSQLTHFMYMHGEDKSSPHIGIIRPLFDKLEERFGQITLFRVKVNMTTPQPGYNDYQPHVAHTDMQYDDGREIPHQVLLYYINDSDGPTYFYNASQGLLSAVEPKMGRAVLFDGSISHAGSSPVKNSARFALNINFRKGLSQKP